MKSFTGKTLTKQKGIKSVLIRLLLVYSFPYTISTVSILAAHLRTHQLYNINIVVAESKVC